MRSLAFFSLIGAALLTACGGSDDDAQIDIQVDRLSYFQVSQFTVSGGALDDKITISTKACTGLQQVGTGTTTQRTVSCTVGATGQGAVTLEVKDSAGKLLKTQSFHVPEPQVALGTTLGRIVVELNPTVAPATTVNFLRYVHSGFYNNTLIHGVVAGSLVQGGYLNTTPAQQLGVLAPIALETNRGLTNARGTLALSRKAGADTATSQFYFNLADNPQLDYASPERPGYAVFGRVVQGLEVLDAIGQVPTNLLYGLPHFPVSDVVITSAVQIQ